MEKLIVFTRIIELKRLFIATLTPSKLPDHDGKIFTRNRSLTLKRMLELILQGITKSLQLQLDDYFEQIGSKEATVSKQAFSKARPKLEPSVIKASFELTTGTICECDNLDFYKEIYRLCAIDGSTRKSILCIYIQKAPRISLKKCISGD